MLRQLLVAIGLLFVAQCYRKGSGDYRFDDEFSEENFEATLRQYGFSEEDILEILEDDRKDEEVFQIDEEDEVSWPEARGYEECEEFMDRNSTKSGEGKRWGEREGRQSRSKHGNKTWYGRHKDHKGHGHHKDHKGHGDHHAGHQEDRERSFAKPIPMSEVCAEYECPPYDTLNSSGCGYEKRRLLSANWTVTPINIKNMKRGMNEAFFRLFKYIRGANEDGVRIAMTVPVANVWFMDDNYKVKGAMMAFYLPAIHQSSPPVPTDSDVTVQQWNDAVTYTRAFGGNHMDPRFYKMQFGKLWKALHRAGETPYTKMSVTAQYTRPGWFRRQRTEVAFIDAGSDSMTYHPWEV